VAEDVGITDADHLRTLAVNLSALRTRLEKVGKIEHIPLDPLATAAASVPEVRNSLQRLAGANEAAVGRLATCLTGADRTLSACAYQAAWVASRYPEMDAEAAKRLEGLVDQASTAAPPPPTGPGTTTRDPRFVSPSGPR
jgi:hypothetical protein